MPYEEVLLGVAGPSGGDVCGAEVSRCRCGRAPGHEPPHACDCGGSWTGEDDSFVPVTFPRDPVAEALGLPPAASRLLAGGIRRGGIRYPYPGSMGDDE